MGSGIDFVKCMQLVLATHILGGKADKFCSNKKTLLVVRHVGLDKINFVCPPPPLRGGRIFTDFVNLRTQHQATHVSRF